MEHGAIAGTITGADSIYVGEIANLANSVTGGAWSSSNAAIAKVSAIGQVSGIAAGNANITYTLTNTCGTANTTHAMKVRS